MRRLASETGLGRAALLFEELESRLVLTIQAMSAEELQSLLSYKQGKWDNIDPALVQLYLDQSSSLPTNGAGQYATVDGIQVAPGAYVVVEAVASQNTDFLVQSLMNLGMKDVVSYKNVIDGLLPVTAIPLTTSLSDLGILRPVYAPEQHAGNGNNQGVQAMNVDLARAQFGVTGQGTMVGVLSDSFNAQGGYATDVASGDLPAGIIVLQDSPFGTDEGRAMLQLVYDVAPGASLAFHTANFGQANFAQGILDLYGIGADVITDDVIYFAEPMFQDGIIAQAVTQVYNNGVAYYSSAGNQAQNGYQSEYVDSGTDLVIDSTNFGTLQDFDPTAGVDTTQQITLNSVGTFTFVFQWDQPFLSASNGQASCQSDYDFFILSQDGTEILASGTTNNLNGDALEIVQFFNDTVGTVVNVAITKFVGADAGLMRWQAMTNGKQMSIDEYDTEGPTLYGHANAQGAQGIGAADYLDTPRFGQSPPLIEDFSSNGPTPILFNTNGARLPAPVYRGQPALVGPDGVTTTVPGFDPFFGTSAAAPNVAAVAALMRQVAPSLTPDQIYSAMQSTAVSMTPPASTDVAGAGLVNALAAVGAVFTPVISLQPDLRANAVGATHYVTAHVVNSLTGQTVEGVSVNFVVTGANPLIGTATTDANGDAVFSYVGQNTGLDQIVADINGVDSNAVFKLWTLASSLRGLVYVDSNNNGQFDPGELPIPKVTIHLTGVDAIGDPVDKYAVTDQNGQYAFMLLTNGDYRLTEIQPAAYIDGQTTPGTAGGFSATNAITDILLPEGFNGVDYLFGELGIRPDFISKRLFLNSTTNQVIPGDVTRPQDATSRAEVSDAVASGSASASGSSTAVYSSIASPSTTAAAASSSTVVQTLVATASTVRSSAAAFQSTTTGSTSEVQRSRTNKASAVDAVLSNVDEGLE